MDGRRFSSSGHRSKSMTAKDVRMERALCASELSYRRLFEAARDGILILDAVTGHINDVNPFLCELLGFSHSEIIGKTIAELSPFKDIESNKAMLEQLQKDGFVHYDDLPLERRDGRKAAVEFVSNVYQVGDHKVIQCNIRDITQRKLGEQSLRESEQKFHQLADNITDVFWITSPDLKIRHYISAGYQLIWGRSTASLYACAHQWIEAVLAEDQARVLTEFAKIMGNAQEMSVEYRIARPDGTIRWIQDRGFQVRDAAGKLVRLAGIASDITERKRAEAELQASREQLRALAARIQTAREEERTHAAREIHDVLAQELTGLKMDVAWLSRRLAEPVASWKQNMLREKVAAMMDLTDKASKSVQGIASELRPVVLDSLGLSAATKWVASDFQKRTEILCRARVPSKDVVINRERSTGLFRILQESLTNVTRHAHATKVEIHLWLKAGEIILTVDDNGRGIRPNELTDAHSMGLLGMQERASLLGGKCTILARTEGGTRVEVRLPRAESLIRDKNV